MDLPIRSRFVSYNRCFWVCIWLPEYGSNHGKALPLSVTTLGCQFGLVQKQCLCPMRPLSCCLNIHADVYGHSQSDEHWSRFKGDVGEISERREWRAWLWALPSAQIPSWAELNWVGPYCSRSYSLQNKNKRFTYWNLTPDQPPKEDQEE